MLRYSLGALLCAVLFVAVACAALANPIPLWSQIVFTATAVLFLGATVFAVVGRPRPVAAGFAVFGWGYLLLASGPFGAAVRPHLLTESLLARLAPLVVDPNVTYPQVVIERSVPLNAWTGGSTLWVAPSDSSVFHTTLAGYPYIVSSSDGSSWLHQIGHTLWAVLFAAVGGALGRLAGKRKGETS
jgi:hypothetical protein